MRDFQAPSTPRPSHCRCSKANQHAPSRPATPAANRVAGLWLVQTCDATAPQRQLQLRANLVGAGGGVWS